MDNSNKIILDLCGGTGSWSRPYTEAGYTVEVVDILYGEYVENYIPPSGVYGILAAPPCTMFSFCRTNAKMPRYLSEGMKTKDIHGEYYGKLSRTARRAITPPGFAKAFFEANR